MGLATFFQNQNYLDLCEVALRLTHRLVPQDEQTNRALVRLYRHRQDYRRAVKHQQFICQERPNDFKAADELRALLVLQTMAAGGYGKKDG